MKCPKCGEYFPWEDSIVVPLKERITKILVLAQNRDVCEHEIWEIILDADNDAIKKTLLELEKEGIIHRKTSWCYWSDDE